MRKEKIFCFGRPIIDITTTIKSEFLKEIDIGEDISREIPTNKMELLLRQLSRRADYIFISAGGVECNVAINSAVLGIPSTIVGAIGDDYLHLMFKNSLGFIKKLDLSLMPVIASNTAVIAVIWATDEDGGRKKIKVLNYGASEFLPWNDLIENRLRDATVFFSSLFSANTSNTEPIWKNAIRAAKNFGKQIIISLGGINTIPKEKLEEMLELVTEYADIIFSNETEYEFLQNEYSQETSLMFPNTELLIITKKERGSSIFCRRGKISIQIPPERIPSPDEHIFEIGAGDAFCAGYIFAFSKGANIEQAGKFATEVSLIKIKYPESHLAKASLSNLRSIKGIDFQ